MDEYIAWINTNPTTKDKNYYQQLVKFAKEIQLSAKIHGQISTAKTLNITQTQLSYSLKLLEVISPINLGDLNGN